MNVYRQSDNTSQIINTSEITADNITTTTLTTNGLTFPGATKGEVLCIEDTQGSVGGIIMSPTTGDVFQANPTGNGLPGYSNNININRVTCNDIVINGTFNGDLLQVYNGAVDRLAIGTQNNVLAVRSGLGEWIDVMSILPDPFTRNELRANAIRLVGAGNGKIFTDTNGYLYSEKPQIFNTGTVVYDQLTTISTFSVYTVAGHSYRLSCNFSSQINSGQSVFNVTIPIVAATFTWVGKPNSLENINYNYTAPTTQGISINLSVTPTGDGIVDWVSWGFDPLGIL